MDVLTYRGPTTPFFPRPKLMDPPHDMEYIVPPSKHYFQDTQHPPPYRNYHGWSPIQGSESYYFPSTATTQRHNIWLDKKNHDRIQNWLSEQHEFAGFPPPEEESVGALRSSSAVEVLNNGRPSHDETLNNHFPKYKSEERIHSTTHRETEEQKRASALRRKYNSPDCIRRRYFSPRSDPNLNTAGTQQQHSVLTARSSSYKHLPPWHNTNSYDNNGSAPDYLNRAFYQGGKGNTFPRRAAQRSTPRNLLNITSKDEMGQQMEKYQQRVLLNPHATIHTDYNHHQVRSKNYSRSPYIGSNVPQKMEEPLLAGRTFVLNGITLQSKQVDEQETQKNTDTEYTEKEESSEKEENSVAVNSTPVDDTPLASTEIIETLKENLKSFSDSSADAAVLASDKSSPLRKQNVRASFHIRVASAPATTDSNKLHRDLYWRNEDEAKRRVSYEVRKVKALSWPKRAILPEQAADMKFVESYTKKMSDNDSSADIDFKKAEGVGGREETEDNEREGVNDEALSDHSDVPPARPPLPPEHMYVKREGSHSSSKRSHDEHATTAPPPESPLEITEEMIVPESRNDVFRHIDEGDENRDCLTSLCSSVDDDVKSSVSSEQQFQHHSNCELSKRVSMSLRDLIRIHEKEIARVSGAFSTRALDKIEETTTTAATRKASYVSEGRKHSFMSDRLKTLTDADHAKWKRHTTIGLLGDFSHENTDHIPDEFTEKQSYDTCSHRTEHYHDNRSDNDGSSLMSPLMSPTSTTSKTFNIAIHSARTTSDGSESNPLSPRLQRSFKSPPSTLPKPKKVTTSSMVTSPLQTVVSPVHLIHSPPRPPHTHGHFQIATGASYTSCMSDSSVQTDERLVRSPSFRRNETRLQELTDEKEKMQKAFEEERKQLNKKLQEQTKLANAYQKLEDRYRKKVYDLQKAMKSCTCTCSPTIGGRYATHSNNGGNHGDGEHFRPDCSSVGDANEISVQKVDVILNKLEAWLSHHNTGITYPESEISSLFGSTHEDIYTAARNNKRPNDYYGAGNGTIPLERIIDRIDATSV